MEIFVLGLRISNFEILGLRISNFTKIQISPKSQIFTKQILNIANFMLLGISLNQEQFENVVKNIDQIKESLAELDK